MRIKLLEPIDLNGFGKVLPEGMEIDVLGDLGNRLVKEKKAKDLDAPVYGFKVQEPKKKIGIKNIHNRKK